VAISKVDSALVAAGVATSAVEQALVLALAGFKDGSVCRGRRHHGAPARGDGDHRHPMRRCMDWANRRDGEDRHHGGTRVVAVDALSFRLDGHPPQLGPIPDCPTG
jgi:hypothetical protein